MKQRYLQGERRERSGIFLSNAPSLYISRIMRSPYVSVPDNGNAKTRTAAVITRRANRDAILTRAITRRIFPLSQSESVDWYPRRRRPWRYDNDSLAPLLATRDNSKNVSSTIDSARKLTLPSHSPMHSISSIFVYFFLSAYNIIYVCTHDYEEPIKMCFVFVSPSTIVFSKVKSKELRRSGVKKLRTERSTELRKSHYHTHHFVLHNLATKWHATFV